MISYAQWAADFRRRAVTEARVVAAVASLASHEVGFGPYRAGPLASLAASGRLGTARVRAVDPDAPSFAVTVPATLDLTVRLGARSQLWADVEIDLRLTPHPVAGLFLFIDAAPVRARDVRITVHGRGLGLAVSGLAGGLPSAVTDEVRRQVARQVTTTVGGSASRRARTIDIAARIDGTAARRPSERPERVDDETFGRHFVAHAVSEDRVSRGFATLTGQQIDLGSRKAGPAGLATVRGSGTVGAPAVRRVEAADGQTEPAFAITLPLDVDLVVGLARQHRFRAGIVARLQAVARPIEGVRIEIDIPPLSPADIEVTVQAADRVAAALGRAGKITDQIATAVCRTVNDRVAGASGRVVDVGAIVEGTSPRRPRPGPGASRRAET